MMKNVPKTKFEIWNCTIFSNRFPLLHVHPVQTNQNWRLPLSDRTDEEMASRLRRYDRMDQRGNFAKNAAVTHWVIQKKIPSTPREECLWV